MAGRACEPAYLDGEYDATGPAPRAYTGILDNFKSACSLADDRDEALYGGVEQAVEPDDATLDETCDEQAVEPYDATLGEMCDEQAVEPLGDVPMDETCDEQAVVPMGDVPMDETCDEQAAEPGETGQTVPVTMSDAEFDQGMTLFHNLCADACVSGEPFIEIVNAFLDAESIAEAFDYVAMRVKLMLALRRAGAGTTAIVPWCVDEAQSSPTSPTSPTPWAQVLSGGSGRIVKGQTS
jgi:hypothetical protein